MSLYLWIDLLSISIPFLVSFHPRINLYKSWKALFLAIFITMIPFIIWDVYFTVQGFWGFNERYLSGFNLLHLPIEEWLFFICIPYACVFTHLSLLEIKPKLMVREGLTKIITLVLYIVFSLTLFLNFDKAYTAVNMIFAIIVLTIVKKFNPKLLQTFYLTFIFMLIPFFIVNGILTGTGIEGNIVWYNNDQNLGIRLGTIPVEDTVYAFSLILMNLFLFFRFSSGSDQQEENL